jgi:hypothetical protein
MITTVGTPTTAGTPAAWYTGNRRDTKNVGITENWPDFISSRNSSNSRDLSSTRFQGR